MDIRDLDRRAIESTGAVIDELTEDQLDLPTPCAKWVVRDVIAHMVGNNHGLVTKLTGEERQPTDDVRRDYRTSAAALSTALASDDALAHKFDFPLLGGEVNTQAMLTVHFNDVLVHGWDLARSIGADITLDPDLVDFALNAMSGLPDNPGIWSDEGSVFAPKRTVPADATPQDRLLALTGRDHTWAPA
ncbi:TIGR03086 family metal-binding protein [Actinokineospora soli]